MHWKVVDNALDAPKPPAIYVLTERYRPIHSVSNHER